MTRSAVVSMRWISICASACCRRTTPAISISPLSPEPPGDPRLNVQTNRFVAVSFLGEEPVQGGLIVTPPSLDCPPDLYVYRLDFGDGLNVSDSTTLRLTDLVGLLGDGLGSSLLLDALGSVAQGYEAEFSYSFGLNGGLIAGYDTRTSDLADFAYLDTRGVLPFATWVERNPDDLWGFDSAPGGYDAGFAEALLRLDAGLDRLQRPDRFKLTSSDLPAGWVSGERRRAHLLAGRWQRSQSARRSGDPQGWRPATGDRPDRAGAGRRRAPSVPAGQRRRRHPVTDRVSLDLWLDRSVPATPVYRASLPAGLHLRADGLVNTDLRATALIELPDARALLGLQAAAALDLYHSPISDTAAQGLVPLRRWRSRPTPPAACG